MLTEAQLFAVGNFDQPTIDGLREALGGGTEALSAAGALSVASFNTDLTISGTIAFTLAAPTVAGQRKRITCVAATSTPLGNLTISAPDTTAGFVLPALVTFTAAGQVLELVATTGLLWRARVGTQRAGTQTLVVGTTLTAGLVMPAIYLLSVTGTVSSTTTKGLPNGLFPGDTCIVGESVAASIPVGNISFAGITTAGAAVTDLGAFGALTDTVTLVWNGLAWMVVANSGVTVS